MGDPTGFPSQANGYQAFISGVGNHLQELDITPAEINEKKMTPSQS
jgi:hypothetical protein